ncbi:P-loop containing nucleoside triphosphate hydrolase [Parasponia andersonii]|uniref:P-loop containing nucleoside triphosphate hydrolase n=1 Tax=Parasponia andersonii TaxID=3476 RepID=A0A2P5A8H9_PARAD|nr:P-loop containing nucleoside triphosphate hydrolase [Parasponia andersonii]
MATLLSATATKLSLKLYNNGAKQENPSTVSRISTGFSFDKDKHCSSKRALLVVSTCAVKNQSRIQATEKINGKTRLRKGGGGGTGSRVLSEGRDEDESYAPICPGCGVFMQDKDPNLPGYYRKRGVVKSDLSEIESEDELEVFDEIEEEEDEDDNDEGDEEEGFLDEIEDEFEESDVGEGELGRGDEFDWDSDEWEAKLLGEEENELDLDGFAPPGVGYGNITEEFLKKVKKEKISKAEKKKKAREAQREKEEVTVCARCHSLRNYGQVKNQAAENLIPDFDFDRLISTRLVKPSGNSNSTVVVMVVDCVDFDGSFPKRAAKSLFKALEGSKDDPKLRKRLPKLVLVATKVDLLPSQISPTRLDRWVRHRARAAGAPKLSEVYLVSSRKDLGVRNLLSCIKDLAGPRGNVWVIGAQNAGKSTLINTLAKKESAKVTKLTEAPVPGTTLGILRVGGILPAKAKLYDTPGLLHPYSVSMRLNRDEQKMVEIRKELQPRTYRMKASCSITSAGQTTHVAGLARLDLLEASVETIYVTIWASPNVSLHMGKIENAEETWRKHVGIRLQPPIGIERASEIGRWEEREVKVSGTSWETNSVDIAVAGLGWFSFGLKGEATLRLWAFDGIEITQREPLVLDRAKFLERSGFWLPKAISDAIGNQTKLEAQKKKLQEEVSA